MASAPYPARNRNCSDFRGRTCTADTRSHGRHTGEGLYPYTRAKGLLTKEIVGQHALKNAGIPIVTVLGLQVNRILAGAVTVEFVFALPGLGSLAVSSVFSRDIPVILGIVMTTAVIIVAVNVVVDLTYGYFNPRARH